MAQNEHINKVVYNGNTLIDLTGCTVAPDKLMLNYTVYDATGALITGTYVEPTILISVVTPPDKVTYSVGDELDLTGIKVQSTLSNGFIKDVTSSCTFSPADGSILDGTISSVSISYTEKQQTYTTSQNITVS